MVSLSEQEPQQGHELQTHPDMLVEQVNYSVLRSGIRLHSLPMALEALQASFEHAMHGVAETVEKQGEWRIAPDALKAFRSGTRIRRIDGEHPFYIVSIQDAETEKAVADAFGTQQGIEHAKVNVRLMGTNEEPLSLDFDRVLDVITTAGATTQVTGTELASHFAKAVKEDWSTSSRVSPSLTAETDPLQVRVSLGFGITGDQLYNTWSTEDAILHTPSHSGYDSLHIIIAPLRSPAFDHEAIGKIHGVTRNIVHAFKAMQPQIA